MGGIWARWERAALWMRQEPQSHIAARLSAGSRAAGLNRIPQRVPCRVFWGGQYQDRIASTFRRRQREGRLVRRRLRRAMDCPEHERAGEPEHDRGTNDHLAHAE